VVLVSTRPIVLDFSVFKAKGLVDGKKSLVDEKKWRKR